MAYTLKHKLQSPGDIINSVTMTFLPSLAPGKVNRSYFTHFSDNLNSPTSQKFFFMYEKRVDLFYFQRKKAVTTGTSLVLALVNFVADNGQNGQRKTKRVTSLLGNSVLSIEKRIN